MKQQRKRERRKGNNRDWSIALYAGTLTLLLIGILLFCFASIWLEPGTSARELVTAFAALLAGSAASGLVYDAFIRRKQEEIAEQNMRMALRRELDSHRNFGRHGLMAIHRRMDVKALLDALQPQDTLWLLDTYDRNQPGWIGPLEEALRRGSHANILVIHPDCDTAEMRALELAESATGFLHNVKDYKATLEGLAERHLNLQIREYTDLPCAPMYLVERDGKFIRGFSSYYLRKPSNTDFPHLEWVAADSSLGPMMLEHVHEKWRTAQQPAASSTRPIGQWIYTLSFHKRTPCTPDVYGKFSIYRDGAELRAEGEAFYVGKQPDRKRDRRGTWRSTGIGYDVRSDHLDHLDITYDMIIQVPREASEKRNYQGTFRLKKSPHGSVEHLFDSVLCGDIFSQNESGEEHPLPFVGTVTAKRLKTPILSGNGFKKVLKQAFEEELKMVVYETESSERPANVASACR